MKRTVDYNTKLARNEAAMRRWTSKLKLATGKLGRLSAQRMRIFKAQQQQAAVQAQRATTNAYRRKFV